MIMNHENTSLLNIFVNYQKNIFALLTSITKIQKFLHFTSDVNIRFYCQICFHAIVIMKHTLDDSCYIMVQYIRIVFEIPWTWETYYQEYHKNTYYYIDGSVQDCKY